MIITLIRDWLTEESTIGRLMIGGTFECFTLEDPVRTYPYKLLKRTAIWGDASYYVAIDYSPKFGRDMLHVLDVPLFEGIRIHSGNDADDTEGCILVGRQKAQNRITQSREALIRLYSKVEIALTAGESVILVVVNPIEMMDPVDVFPPGA
jgi:hypothetical protein